MRSPNRFLKITVLSGFTLLLTSFVMYRSGAFEKYLEDEKETALGGLNMNEVDSPPAKKEPHTIMPGSKVGIWIEEPAKQDTAKKKSQGKNEEPVPNQQASPQGKNNQNNYNAPNQSATPQQNNNQKNTSSDKPVRHIMRGSKSAPIIIEREPDTAKQAPK